jgi:hypothetical protein
MHKNLKYHQASPSVGVPMENGHDRGRAQATAVRSWAVLFAGGLIMAGHDCGRS